MPRYSATFEALEGDAGLYDCCICHKNPATLKCSGIRGGPCCLQCAFSVWRTWRKRPSTNWLTWHPRLLAYLQNMTAVLANAHS